MARPGPKNDAGSDAVVRPSMRKAINAKCKDCIYDPLAGGTWRQQTEACTITACSLWPLRPRSSAA